MVKLGGFNKSYLRCVRCLGSFRLSSFNLKQFLNAFGFISITESGITNSSNSTHKQNVYKFIFFKFFDRFIDFNL